jgi:hypothetical protein
MAPTPTPTEEVEDPIEPYLVGLALPVDVPEKAVSACLDRYAEAGPFLRRALEKYAQGQAADEEAATFLFRAVHIMGGARDAQAFEPLVRALGRPAEDVDFLLGTAVTETLPDILIGTFNGNADILFDAIADQKRDELIRDSLLRAATFLAWEGRIDRQRMVSFLERFGSGDFAVAGEFVWNAWVDAIALLGLRQLEPLAMQALAKGLIDDAIFDREVFRAQLERAERDPADISRFTDVDIGYLEDVFDTLRSLEEDDEDGFWGDGDQSPVDNQPITNPWRHVGRNDPCPCGSGKKAKRCCLAD